MPTLPPPCCALSATIIGLLTLAACSSNSTPTSTTSPSISGSASVSYPTYWIADGTTNTLPSVSSLTWTNHDGQLTGAYQDIHAPIPGQPSTLAGTLTGTLTGTHLTLEDSAPAADPSLGTDFQTGTITPTTLSVTYTIDGHPNHTDYTPGTAAQFNQLAAQVLGTK